MPQHRGLHKYTGNAVNRGRGWSTEGMSGFRSLLPVVWHCESVRLGALKAGPPKSPFEVVVAARQSMTTEDDGDAPPTADCTHQYG